MSIATAPPPPPPPGGNGCDLNARHRRPWRSLAGFIMEGDLDVDEFAIDNELDILCLMCIKGATNNSVLIYKLGLKDAYKSYNSKYHTYK